MSELNDATRAQVKAANPRQNTWVLANAGSGKTRVLTDRVARLLLNGVRPERILCLTYTKAAATQMQNRLFSRLGKWAMMPEEKLYLSLQELGENISDLNADKLAQARRLFASALETPGGLKIQTIHSFCDSILRRFPLEAGITPNFEILDNRKATLIRQMIIDEMASNDQQDIIDIIDRVGQFFTGFDLNDLARLAVYNQDLFKKEPVYADFGIDKIETDDVLCKRILSGLEGFLEQLLVGIENSSSNNDIKQVPFLQSIFQATSPFDKIITLEKIFFTQAHTRRKNFPTQKAFDKSSPIHAQIDEICDRIDAVRNQRLAQQSYKKTCALYQFAQYFLKAYDNHKAILGLFDYDDLIKYTIQLLSYSSMAQWVLYRLDGGIDHILVDEAQDTSPPQWDIIDYLAREFTFGSSANERPRTLFVVGDEKQSIYSFQGADPDIFKQKKIDFNKQFMNINMPFSDCELLYSFRSAPPILTLVDHIFTNPENDVTHLAFFDKKPGRVDLWPFIEATKISDDRPWYQPLDMPSALDPKQSLAQNIAIHVAEILQNPPILQCGDEKRAIDAGDILILVQSRGGSLFSALLKELKKRHLPVAGADRLNVGDELAVRDILSLLNFLTVSSDDLSLAEAIRSPLLNLSEGDLFKLSHERKGTLWHSMRNDPAYRNTVSMLEDLRAVTGYLRPYELIERLLVHHNGKKRLIARLGEEIQEGLDEFLAQAIIYEQTEPPTLTGFLQWFASSNVEIKRDLGAANGKIRIMSVHGAKGLEAPVVILPDTGEQKNTSNDAILKYKTKAIWRGNKNEKTSIQKELEDRKKSFEIAEKTRLLYVAMTRAESWLIICGAGKRGSQNNTWYNIIDAAMNDMACDELDTPVGKGITLQNPQWQAQEKTPPLNFKSRDEFKLPMWLKTKAPPIARPLRSIAPSHLKGAKSLDRFNDLDEEHAMRQGRLIHLLLEYLPNHPPPTRAKYGRYLLRREAKAEETETQDLISQACALLDNPKLAHIFGANALPEVGITAQIDDLGSEPILGYIDRLVITDDTVLAVDFKSNVGIPKQPEHIPAGILAQQACYFHALKKIYPDHEISVAILWTRTGELMEISNKIVNKVLLNITMLDDQKRSL